MTGCDLKYTAVVGKPSEITYHYAERVLQREAEKLKLPRLCRMYCIGSVFVIHNFSLSHFSCTLAVLAKEILFLLVSVVLSFFQ